MSTESETSFSLRVGSRSDRGLVRPLNEDALLVADGIYAVCDGMGGHEAGEVASRMCAQILGDGYQDLSGAATQADVAALLDAADQQIRAAIGARGGTTATGLALVRNSESSDATNWCVFNVGDSRTYLFDSEQNLMQLTQDHSQVQELVALGQLTPEQAAVHPRRHVITRALGAGQGNAADTWVRPVKVADRFLVCSDGLSGEVHEETIADVLRDFEDPQLAADRLVQLAIESGGRDNATVIVLDVENSPISS